MPNDPKEQTIDWSKVTAPQGNNPSPSMITSLNEGANLMGVETSSQHSRMVGVEIFTANSDKQEK